MKIELQNLSMTYPNGRQALRNLNLSLEAPSLVGLLGPNGAGKSTLMKLLVAALTPTGGSILVDGQPLERAERLLKARLGYLPQDFGLFDELTTAQFLDYMAALKGIRDSRAAVKEVLQGLGRCFGRFPAASASGRASPRRCWEIRSCSFLTSPRWALTRRSGCISEACFPGRPRSGLCCSAPTSLRMCSPYATV